MKTRLDDLLETVRVRWLLMDEQVKHAIILAVLYAAYTLFDVTGAVIRSSLKGEN